MKNIRLIWGLILAGNISAQTFTTLHDFTVGQEGNVPYSGLILSLSGNTLYGTTYFDTNGPVNGTVFALSTDGTSFTILHHFPPFDQVTATNSDGDGPIASLTLAGDTLYGTAVSGGVAGSGTVFALSTDGTGFKVLHPFSSSSDGGYPYGGLILSGNTIYGTATRGGDSNDGTVFALGTSGSGFTVLHSFTSANDGGWPDGTLVLSGDRLYGTTSFGGVNSGNGTVFALNTNGSGFTILHTFTGGDDGSGPYATLVLSSNTLYGTADFGGVNSGNGTVFALNVDGTGFKVLHTFSALTQLGPASPQSHATNSDGAFPSQGGLILSKNTLYGETSGGGAGSRGTVFAINTDGTGFTVLHHFNGGHDGGTPNGRLTLSGNSLYGTALSGGNSGGGTVFRISVSPQPTITTTGSSVILSWPTNYAGFDYTGYTLQSTMDLASPVWTTNLPAPFVMNGQYTISNHPSSKQQFFRLTR